MSFLFNFRFVELPDERSISHRPTGSKRVSQPETDSAVGLKQMPRGYGRPPYLFLGTGTDRVTTCFEDTPSQCCNLTMKSADSIDVSRLWEGRLDCNLPMQCCTGRIRRLGSMTAVRIPPLQPCNLDLKSADPIDVSRLFKIAKGFPSFATFHCNVAKTPPAREAAIALLAGG